MTVADYNRSVDDFSDGIYRFILKNIKNHDKAKDVVQDTYEKLWLRVGEVSPDKARAYLFTTAYHTMIDMIRKESRNEDFDALHHDRQIIGPVLYRIVGSTGGSSIPSSG